MQAKEKALCDKPMHTWQSPSRVQAKSPDRKTGSAGRHEAAACFVRLMRMDLLDEKGMMIGDYSRGADEESVETEEWMDGSGVGRVGGVETTIFRFLFPDPD